MNRGFKYYFRRSWNMTLFMYKRLNFLKKLELTMFLLVCYIGCSIFFLRPLFSIALMNASRMIEESHNLSISKCFEGITKNSRFKELFIADLYIFMLIGVIACVCFIPNLTYFFGYNSSKYEWLAKTIFWSTISIASLAGIIIEFKYLPLSYVASGSINTSAGDMLLNVRHVKRSMVVTEMLLMFVQIFLASLFIAGPIVGIIITYNTVFYRAAEWIWLILGLYLALVVFLFCPVTIFLTVMHTALYELYKDTVSLKKVYVVKELPGTEVGYASIFPTEKDEVELLKEEKLGGKNNE